MAKKRVVVELVIEVEDSTIEEKEGESALVWENFDKFDFLLDIDCKSGLAGVDITESYVRDINLCW